MLGSFKFIIFLIFVFSFDGIWAKVEKTKKNLDQIWTFNFYELEQLSSEHKTRLIKNFIQEAQQNKVLKKIKEFSSPSSIQNIFESETQWNLVENKITHFCFDSHNFSDCEKISELRLEIIRQNSPRN